MEAVKAIKIVSKEHPDVFLLFLGSGPAVPSIESSIKSESLENNLMIHSSVNYSEVPKYIDLGDVCLVPLPDNPFWRAQSPLKLLEYLSMEKTVIATNLPAHRTVLDNQECGIYLSSTNPEVIAKAIEHALINKNKLADWGKIGRKIVLEKYTWEKVAADFQSYLMSIT
jgi:glycosyltransferase involved in cell wall biosynthesis